VNIRKDILDRKYYPRTKVLQTDEIIKEVKIFLSDMSWKPSTRFLFDKL